MCMMVSYQINLKRTHCGESILCLAYYGIHIQNYTDVFIMAHNFRSTMWSFHSTRGVNISTAYDPKSSGRVKSGA